MEQLIYTDANRIDQGVLSNATLDLEYGGDESDQANTFEVSIDRNSKIRLEDKALVYIEGTEYGGKITGIGTNTGEDVITYKGMTWHGLLNAHVLGPDSGQDYLVLSGEAHTVIRSLIERMNLQDIFTAPMTSSGININYQVRYEYGYFAILAMLAASSAKLKMTYDNGMVVLSAEPIADYSDSDELDTTQIELEIDKDYLPVNHLVCLGEGELKNRIVLHFYADADGNVSTTQSLFGADENTLIYDYTNADSDELSEKGQEKLKELQNCDTVKVDIPEGRVLDIGDLVGAIDPITGIYVATEVTYKTVTISSNGLVSIAYKVGDTSASKSMTGRSESSGGGVSYSAGKGITIAGRTINADVDAEDLQGVSNLAQDAKEQASDAASTASAAQQTADGKADAVHTHAAADTTSGVFDLDRIPTIPASKLSGTLDIAGGGTGANNAADAANNLAVYYLGVREPIPTNADLNNYKTVGSYGTTSNAVAATVLNTPLTNPVAFILTVEKNIAIKNPVNFSRQIFHDRTGKIYTRFIEGDTWSDWIKIANETDLANYLPLTGGTLTGTVNTRMLNVGSYNDNTERTFSVRRGFNLDSDKPTQVQAMVNVGSDQALFSFRGSDNSSKNYLQLLEDKTRLKNALALDSGGTGANSAEQARENLGAASVDHTHNYAGSSSPGGAATSANKLATARTIKLTGAVNGQATFDGSKDITINVEGDSAAAGFLAAHPVGSVYESTSSTSPATTYGGTWKYCPGFEFHRWVRTA